MKVRVITEGNAVVGYQVVEPEPPMPGQFRAGLIAGPGQKLHELEVANDFPIVPSPEEIHRKLAAHLAKKVAA